MGGAHIAIHHAKKRRLREQREEEHLIGYSNKELAQDYEFKILRSYVSGFNDPQRLNAILDAEARAGPGPLRPDGCRRPAALADQPRLLNWADLVNSWRAPARHVSRETRTYEHYT